MKFGRKIFLTRGLYNSLGTFVRHSRDLFDFFYEILRLNFRLVMLRFFGIFRAKMINLVGKYFSHEESTIDLGPSYGFFITCLTVLINYQF